MRSSSHALSSRKGRRGRLLAALAASVVAGTLAISVAPPAAAKTYEPTTSAALVQQFAYDVIEAREELGISADDHTLTAAEFDTIFAMVNGKHAYDTFMIPSSDAGNLSVPPATPSDDSPSSGGPGPNQTAVCAANPYDCARAASARDDSYTESARYFPTQTGVDDRRDALRHCIWQALTTERANAEFAKQIGDAHEADGFADGTNTPESYEMDQANNNTGRGVGLRREGQPASAIYSECEDLVEAGGLVWLR